MRLALATFESFGMIEAVEARRRQKMTLTTNEGHSGGWRGAQMLFGYPNPQKAIRDHVDEDDRTVNESFTPQNMIS